MKKKNFLTLNRVRQFYTKRSYRSNPLTNRPSHTPTPLHWVHYRSCRQHRDYILPFLGKFIPRNLHSVSPGPRQGIWQPQRNRNYQDLLLLISLS
jgi:hypothetical protein